LFEKITTSAVHDIDETKIGRKRKVELLFVMPEKVEGI